MARKNAFHGVVWDVDGTLIDSEPLHYEALLAVCARYGRNVDEERNREMLGLSLTAVWDVLGAAGTSFATTRDAWIAAILDYYVDNVSGSMARPGARDTVEMLAANGVAQAAVSTAERRVVMANLEAVGASVSGHTRRACRGRPALALGAIVAPPDAAAATAVLKQLRPPHRLLVILEGESLFNHASALRIYRFAILRMVSSCPTPSLQGRTLMS